MSKPFRGSKTHRRRTGKGRAPPEVIPDFGSDCTALRLWLTVRQLQREGWFPKAGRWPKVNQMMFGSPALESVVVGPVSYAELEP